MCETKCPTCVDGSSLQRQQHFRYRRRVVGKQCRYWRSCFVAKHWRACEQLVRQQAAEWRQTMRPLSVVWSLAAGCSFSGRDDKEWNCQKVQDNIGWEGPFCCSLGHSRERLSRWAWERSRKNCAGVTLRQRRTETQPVESRIEKCYVISLNRFVCGWSWDPWNHSVDDVSLCRRTALQAQNVPTEDVQRNSQKQNKVMFYQQALCTSRLFCTTDL